MCLPQRLLWSNYICECTVIVTVFRARGDVPRALPTVPIPVILAAAYIPYELVIHVPSGAFHHCSYYFRNRSLSMQPSASSTVSCIQTRHPVPQDLTGVIFSGCLLTDTRRLPSHTMCCHVGSAVAVVSFPMIRACFSAYLLFPAHSSFQIQFLGSHV